MPAAPGTLASCSGQSDAERTERRRAARNNEEYAIVNDGRNPMKLYAILHLGQCG
jgi:hypothetical protein